MLANQVDFEGRSPEADNAIRVGMIDTAVADHWIELGNRRAWNWQQGCMLLVTPSRNARVEFGVGQQPLQSAILLLEILQPLGRGLFRTPPYFFFFSRVRLLRHTDLLDRLGNRLTSPHLDFDLS